MIQTISCHNSAAVCQLPGLVPEAPVRRKTDCRGGQYRLFSLIHCVVSLLAKRPERMRLSRRKGPCSNQQFAKHFSKHADWFWNPVMLLTQLMQLLHAASACTGSQTRCDTIVHFTQMSDCSNGRQRKYRSRLGAPWYMRQGPYLLHIDTASRQPVE